MSQPANTYVYSVVTDFHALTEELNIGQLQAALNSVWFPSNASYIITNGDEVDITFTNALSGAQQTALTGYINAYQNVYLSYVIGNDPDTTAVIFNKLQPGDYEGSSVASTWVTRKFNTVDGVVGLWITLNADSTFTIQPGKYMLTAFVPAYQVGRHQARLYNLTQGVEQALGTSAYNSQLSEIHSLWINNRPDTFAIQHFCTLSVASVGLGIPLNPVLLTDVTSSEMYTIMKIEKLH